MPKPNFLIPVGSHKPKGTVGEAVAAPESNDRHRSLTKPPERVK